MIMKDAIESLLGDGSLRTYQDLAVNLGTTEATVRARVSDLRREGTNIAKARIRDFTTRNAMMLVG